MSNAIIFDAAVYSVKTLVDGGIRVTLDLSENNIPEMAMLAECKRSGIVLNMNCTPAISIEEKINAKRRSEIFPYKT
jgi:hypothetical protein